MYLNEVAILFVTIIWNTNLYLISFSHLREKKSKFYNIYFISYLLNFIIYYYTNYIANKIWPNYGPPIVDHRRFQHKNSPQSCHFFYNKKK